MVLWFGFQAGISCESVLLPNVRDDGSPLAFGADPASAGYVTKVPKAW